MKKRSPIHAYKRLLANDHNWDYGYLIALEKKKLQRMHDCIKREGHLENNAIVTRDIAICIRLIDIFMEDDAVYNTWLHQSFSGEMKFRKLTDGNYQLDDTDRKPLADLPVYVNVFMQPRAETMLAWAMPRPRKGRMKSNVKNERRFFRATPIRDAQAECDRDKAILSTVSLRQQKALHLYHLIREYKLLTWWD